MAKLERGMPLGTPSLTGRRETGFQLPLTSAAGCFCAVHTPHTVRQSRGVRTQVQSLQQGPGDSAGNVMEWFLDENLDEVMGVWRFYLMADGQKCWSCAGFEVARVRI